MTYAATTLDVRPATGLLKALADDTRLRIVALLAHGELCVCHLTVALEVSQPNASQHLSVLRAAGVVEGRREGSWIHYTLAPQADPVRAHILRSVVESYAGLGVLAEDVRRLRGAQDTVSCR